MVCLRSGRYGSLSSWVQALTTTSSYGNLRLVVDLAIQFATTLAGSAYVAAALYTNADTNEWSEKLGHGSWWRRGSDLPTDEEIKRAKAINTAQVRSSALSGQTERKLICLQPPPLTAQGLQNSLSGLVKSIRDWPESLKVPITRVYISLSETYLHTPPAQLVCLGIIGFNGLVFLAWRIPRFEPLMRRYFMHWPVGANHRVITLATSVFSHQSLPHYAFNSIALYSFGSAAYTFLSRPNAQDIDAINNESWFGFDFGPYLGTSTTTPHFLAFFLAAGLISSLTSHLNTVLVRLPRLLRDLSNTARVSTASALAAHSAVLPSLGASGAIYATLTLTSLAFPEASVSLIFLPFIPIQIGYGVAGMVAVDVLGLIRGWR